MIIVYAVENLFKKEWIKILVYTILSMIGFFMSIMHIINSLFIGQALLVIPFFVNGYKFKEYWLSRAWINWKLLFLCLIIAYFSFYYVWTNIHQFIFSTYYFPSLIAAFAFNGRAGYILPQQCLKVILPPGRCHILPVQQGKARPFNSFFAIKKPQVGKHQNPTGL